MHCFSKVIIISLIAYFVFLMPKTLHASCNQSKDPNIFKIHGTEKNIQVIEGECFKEFIKSVGEGKDIDISYSKIKGDIDFCKTEYFQHFSLEEAKKTLKEDYVSHLKPVKQTYFGIEFKIVTINGNINIVHSIIEGNIRTRSDKIKAVCYFSKNVDFSKTLFDKDVDFIGAKFNSNADFWGTEFNSKAELWGIKFNSKTNFTRTRFNSKADFEYAIFDEDANFSYADFISQATFRQAKFGSKTDFIETKFANKTDFTGVKFGDSVYFIKAVFSSAANFLGAEFASESDFEEVKFLSYDDVPSGDCYSYEKYGSGVSFSCANFDSVANFRLAEFGSQVDFIGTKFNDLADFIESKFSDTAKFLSAEFASEADFWNAEFSSETSFTEAQFRLEASFKETKFNSVVYFKNIKFSSVASFDGARFGKMVYFRESNFDSEANFSKTMFGEDADFWKVRFGNNCSFKNTIFGIKSVYTQNNLTRSNVIKIIANDINISIKKMDGLQWIFERDYGDIDEDDKFYIYFPGNENLKKELSTNSVNLIFAFRVAINRDTDTKEITAEKLLPVEQIPGNFPQTMTLFENATFSKFADFRNSLFLGNTTFKETVFKEVVLFDNNIFFNAMNLKLVKENDEKSLISLDFDESYFNLLKGLTYNQIFQNLNKRINLPSKEADIQVIEKQSINTYKYLQENFRKIGNFEDADKIYYERKLLEANDVKNALRLRIWNWCLDKTCKYGTSPERIVLISVLVIGFFWFLYSITYISIIEKGLGTIEYEQTERRNKVLEQTDDKKNFENNNDDQVQARNNKTTPKHTWYHHLWHSFYLSLNTFTTVGTGDIIATRALRVFVLIEGALGWFILGLFIVVLSSKYFR